MTHTLPIVLKLATDRDDKGETDNYRVYAGGGTVTVKNKKGETVQKNTILGGNGTIYIANELAKPHTEWVLMPKAQYDTLTARVGVPSQTKPLKKGK